MNDALTGLGGKSAIITGASSGIGKAIAEVLASCGADLVLVARNETKLSRIAAELRSTAGTVETVTGDFERREEIHTIGSRLDGLLDRVDVLAHCAGMIEVGPLGGFSETAAEAMFMVNFWAPCILTHRLLPKVIRAEGQLVFMNSSVTHQPPKPDLGYYSATKQALSAVSQSIRGEVNPHGVRVLSVFPGKTATPMQERLHSSSNRAFRPAELLQPMDVAVTVVRALTLPRTAEITDVFVRPMKKAL